MIVLVMVALLFGLVLFLGPHDEPGDPLPDSSAWKKLFDGWIPEVMVEPRAVTDPGNCLREDTFTVPMSGSCTASIKQARPRVRTLALRLMQGNEARVEFAPDAEDQDMLPVGLSLKAGKVAKVQIPKLGGELTLACKSVSGPPFCLLKIDKGAG